MMVGIWSCPFKFSNYVLTGCIINNEFVGIILNPVMLEISLRNLWSMNDEAFSIGTTDTPPTGIYSSFSTEKIAERKT